MPNSAPIDRHVADAVVTCDGDSKVHLPGAVDVSAGRIVRVGPVGGAPDVDGTVYDHGGLLMPGLINAHAHTPMTLVRGAGDGLPLQRWLTEAMWPREGRMTPEDVWWGMVLGSAEMLAAGVTTSCEMYLFEDALVDAVRATGGRLVMTPAALSVLHGDAFGSDGDRLDAIAAFHAEHHDPLGRVTVGVAPHSAYDLGVGRVADLAELSRSIDAVLHLHVAETRGESAALEAEYGRSIVQILADHDVFAGRTLMAHGVWVDAEDIDILVSTETAVAHCPVSNMKLGSGVAPVAAMLDAGVTVALGTDGPASNDTLDLWEEVKVAPLLARVNALDPTVLPAGLVLEMATREGANAVGLQNVGSLVAGMAADMIRIDLGHPSFTPVTCTDELLAHLVWAGSSRSVTDVWVQGERVVEARVVQTVDVERARAEVQNRAERLAGA